VENACRLLSQFIGGKISEAELFKAGASPKKRSTIPLKDRWKVLKRDNYKCVKCGASPPEVKLEIDHIVPFSKGGNNALENLQTMCDRCNQGKKNKLE